MQPADTLPWWVGAWATFIGLFAWVHPETAAGAIFGGMFFWGLNPEIAPRVRFWFLVASVGLGYGLALPAARSEGWQAWAWGFAGLATALIYVAIVSLRATIQTGSPLPPWMTALADSLPWRKNRDEP